MRTQIFISLSGPFVYLKTTRCPLFQNKFQQRWFLMFFCTNLRSLPQSSFVRKVTLIDEVSISDSLLLFFPTLQISSNDQLSYQNSLVVTSFCPLGCATVSYQQHQSTVMLESSGIAIATVHSILVVIDIVGNCLVCAIIKKNQDMRYGTTRITLPFWDANASLWYSWVAGTA